MSDLLIIDRSLPTKNDEKLQDILLHGNGKFNRKTNQNILIRTWKFIKDSRRFGNSLFYMYYSRTFFWFTSYILYDNVLTFSSNS